MKTYPQLLLRNPKANAWLRRLNAGWRARAERTLLARTALRLEKIGSEYGGWRVPVDLIRPDWIVYAGGVGEDISFDLGLIERFGVEVHAFDPTPRAVQHVGKVASGQPRYHFSPIGLWSSRTTLKFFAPKDSAHVSHSALNLQATDRYFEAECWPLAALMAERGHQRIDLLKIDIEGAEYETLGSMLDHRLDVRVVAVEFDQPVPWWTTGRMVHRLIAAGYALIDIDEWNFVFVQRKLLERVPS